MSTQAIRNIIRISISRIIPEVKKKVIEEGNKKLSELEEKLSSPEEIMKILDADIDVNSCSTECRDKFHEKAEKLKGELDEIGDLVSQGLLRIQKIEEKIAPIADQLPSPPGLPDPLGNIDQITSALGKITDALQYVIMAAPAILAASSGPAANGAVIANTNNNVNLAKTKIEEYQKLGKSTPRLLDRYKNMANPLVRKIQILRDKVQSVMDKIDQLKMFIIYLELEFEAKCDNFFANPNPPIEEPPLVPPPLTLDDVIAQFEALYGDLLNNLILQGNQIAIKRVFVLGENFEKIKNKIGNVKYTSVKRIYP